MTGPQNKIFIKNQLTLVYMRHTAKDVNIVLSNRIIFVSFASLFHDGLVGLKRTVIFSFSRKVENNENWQIFAIFPEISCHENCC
jgi:hypothetical protein